MTGGPGELLAMLAILVPIVVVLVVVLLVVAALRVWHHVAAIRRSVDRYTAQVGIPPEQRGTW